MAKQLIERLHVATGVLSTEKYVELVTKLATLPVVELKKYYAIYRVLVEHCVDLVGLAGEQLTVVADREAQALASLNPEVVRDFVAERVSDDYLGYLDPVWEANLQTVRDELSGLELYRLTEVAICAHTLSAMVEGLLLTADEFWYPHLNYSLWLYEQAGHSLLKEKERIWQPKTT